MSVPDHIEKKIREKLPKMEGWMQPERGIQFADLILEIKPKVIVEIGVFGGRSMFCFALALRHLNEGGVYYGLDPWEAGVALEGQTQPHERDWWKKIPIEEIHQKAMHVIWDNNLDKWAVVIRAASQHCYRLFKEIDVLSIDGSHVEHVACRDVELYLPLLKPGGYLLFDDSDWTSTQKALRMVEETCTLMRDDGRETHNSLYRKHPF